MEAVANVGFPCVLQIQKIFDKHIHTQNQNLHYKLTTVFFPQDTHNQNWNCQANWADAVEIREWPDEWLDTVAKLHI